MLSVPVHSKQRLHAVCHILQADPALKKAVLPLINFQHNQIKWHEIRARSFPPQQRAALLFARSLWCDKAPIRQNPIFACHAMDARMRTIALQALAIYWGLVPDRQDLNELS